MARKPAPKSPAQSSTAQQILIHEPVRVPFAKLNFAPYNPRTISAEEMRTLKASIRKHGLVLTLVVQKSSAEHGPMVIVGGHQRVQAVRELATEMGIPVPTDAWAVLVDIDDATAKQLNISLNRISGEFDPHKLGLVLAGIAGTTDFDLSSIGFGQNEVDELIKHATMSAEDMAALLEAEAGDGLGGFAKSITLTVEFETVEQRDAGKALLKQLSPDGKPGGVLISALKLLGASAKKKRPSTVAAAE
jgi:ParB-like chromosome segregation protein Spo0J